MNRRALLAAVAALPLLAFAGPHRASAQGGLVHDPVHTAMNAASWIKQARDMIQQYRMLEATYSSLAHATDVAGVASALGGPVRTYMPEAGQVTDLLAGSGSLWGTASRLLSMGRFADVGTETPWAREMQRRETVTANARAIAAAGLESAQQSVAGLTSLLDRISGSQDVTEVSAVGGALQVEGQNIAHHRAQLDQVRLMLETEERTERQRAEQMQYESARELFENTRPFGSLQ